MTMPAYIMIFFVTLIAGFTNSFLAMYMMHVDVLVSYFFAPQSVALVLSRLTVMRVIDGFSLKVKMAASFALLSTSYLFILKWNDWWSFALSGTVCGIGASIAYPTLSIWLSGQFAEDQKSARTKVVSFFNAAYFFGSNVSAFVGGFVISKFGERILIEVLVCLGIISIIYVLTIGQSLSREAAVTAQAASASNRR